MTGTGSPRATIGVLSDGRRLVRDFVPDHVEMVDDVDMQVRFTVDDEALTDLHRLAFGSSATAVQPWAHRLERHSLTWIGAFVGRTLVGFVQVCWDGGSHAFVLDTVVHPDHQRRGIGRNLVLTGAAEARRAGCQWLHVDYETHWESFYRDSCGFRPPDAGLLDLNLADR